MQAQATGNCTVTVQVRGHEIVGFETGGDDWRYGHIVSHAVFEAVEKATDALKARPAHKRAKTEPSQEPATVKTEPVREPAVKTEPREKPARKTAKARDKPVKAEPGAALVDLVSEEEREEEYVEEDLDLT